MAGQVVMITGAAGGIGMALVVPRTEAEDILGRLSGLDEKAWLIGEIAQTETEQIELLD